MNLIPKFSTSWIFLLFGILGYFGVSDADVVLRNHPYGYSPSTQNTHSSSSSNNNNKLRGSDQEVPEEERLLDQVVINALANPSEWVHLRQLFERVDDEISRTNQGANSSSAPLVIHTGKELMSSTLSPSFTSEKPVTPRPKFSYHRVIEGSRKGRPFAAVTLMDTQAIPSDHGIGDEEEERYSWNKMRVGHHHEARHHRNHHSHHHQRNDGHHHTHRNNHHHHQH